MKIGRGNRSTRRKPAPAPLCPPQISHDYTRVWIRAAAVGSQRLTAWAMARPKNSVSTHRTGRQYPVVSTYYRRPTRLNVVIIQQAIVRITRRLTLVMIFFLRFLISLRIKNWYNKGVNLFLLFNFALENAVTNILRGNGIWTRIQQEIFHVIKVILKGNPDASVACAPYQDVHFSSSDRSTKS
jgi:hypothetical protein